MSSASIVWANDVQGVARYILEVKTGLECNCVCPGCGAALEAVNSQNLHWKNRPHFRHYEASELEDCAASAVLVAAREVIKTIKEIKLPAFEEKHQLVASSGKVITGSARVEEEVTSVEAVELVDSTDAILTLAGGLKIRVRLVANMHRSSDPSEPVTGEIAINLLDPVLRTADPEILRQHITLGNAARTWCHYYNEQALQKLALQDANEKLANYVAHQPPPPPPRPIEKPAIPFQQPSRPISQSPIIKQHIPLPDTQSAIRTMTRNIKTVSCNWRSEKLDSSRWPELIPTWENIFGDLYQDLLDAGMTARDFGQDSTAALYDAAAKYGFSPQAVIGLWIAAGVAYR